MTTVAARWAVIIACVLLRGVTAETARAAESPKTESTTEQVARAAWWGDYQELQRLYDAAKASKERTSGGRYTSGEFVDGYARIFNGNNTDAYYADLEALTRQWAMDHPDSSMAQNLYARALYARAWFLRGGGFAYKVSPQAWGDFQKYIALAIDHLSQRAAVVKADTTTTIHLIMLERSAGASFAVQWAIAREGLRREPDNVDIYDQISLSALEKWGGNADRLEEIARYAATTPASDRAAEIYARVYLYAAFEYQGALFARTRADWSQMKAGFEQMLTRFPDPRLLNQYAYAACLAQDKAATREMLAKIGAKPMADQWDGQNALDTCTRWVRSE
jgi:hypothetical protein